MKRPSLVGVTKVPTSFQAEIPVQGAFLVLVEHSTRNSKNLTSKFKWNTVLKPGFHLIVTLKS